MKVIIIGGVAGGASCAARLRRLSEDAQIILVERGEYISYGQLRPALLCKRGDRGKGKFNPANAPGLWPPFQN